MEQAIQLLQQSLDTSFLDAYIENGENILDDFQVRVLDGVPNPETVKQLETLYHTIKNIDLAPEDVRRLSQLLLLKGTRKEQLQANHQLTPSWVGQTHHTPNLIIGLTNCIITCLTNNLVISRF